MNIQNATECKNALRQTSADIARFDVRSDLEKLVGRLGPGIIAEIEENYDYYAKILPVKETDTINVALSINNFDGKKYFVIEMSIPLKPPFDRTSTPKYYFYEINGDGTLTKRDFKISKREEFSDICEKMLPGSTTTLGEQKIAYNFDLNNKKLTR